MCFQQLTENARRVASQITEHGSVDSSIGQVRSGFNGTGVSSSNSLSQLFGKGINTPHHLTTVASLLFNTFIKFQTSVFASRLRFNCFCVLRTTTIGFFAGADSLHVSWILVVLFVFCPICASLVSVFLSSLSIIYIISNKSKSYIDNEVQLLYFENNVNHTRVN